VGNNAVCGEHRIDAACRFAVFVRFDALFTERKHQALPMAKPAAEDDPLSRVVCRNRRAKHEYDLLQQLECGMVLYGSEVKSIRANKISIEEAYVRVKDGEVWMHNCDIAEYPQATYMNHEPRRSRKLLMHRREVKKFAEAASVRGLTMVPLDVHLSRGLVKVTVAVARGRKMHDKREKLKQKDAQAEIQQAKRLRAR
jgi:SsrA-binding protein